MRRLLTYVEPERTCGYLPGRPASLEHQVIADVSPAELEPMLLRGWRRFGPIYFRPVCSPCAECVSIRIPTDRFRPTASQVRARRRASRFRIALGTPRVDEERLALYARWHEGREARRGWDANELGREEYAQQFAFPHSAARELTFREGERLVAVGYVDVTPSAWSDVFFFYDPSIARLSPGIANVVLSIELARERAIPYVYLGYRVEGCYSMRYKSFFRPHELLTERPAPDQEPHWREATAEPPAR